jgi:hypothetical protein
MDDMTDPTAVFERALLTHRMGRLTDGEPILAAYRVLNPDKLRHVGEL